MDTTRFGLAVRALRRRRGWTQERLATEAVLSRPIISRIERSKADSYPVCTLEKVVAALGGQLRVTIKVHGEELDRLLDAGHAELVELVVALLRAAGWEVAPETTFNVYGERGSIDIFAFHPPTGSLLVIEVKSAIPDVQGTLSGLDRKVRLAPRLARERGWQVRTVSRWLVVPADVTTRRRVDRHKATFGMVLPLRTVALRQWAAAPSGTASGILFVANARSAVARARVGAASGPKQAVPRSNDRPPVI
ncbi:MAG: helix-turn-helix domain-containing protein [Chloroflexota bacterium]